MPPPKPRASLSTPSTTASTSPKAIVSPPTSTSCRRRARKSDHRWRLQTQIRRPGNPLLPYNTTTPPKCRPPWRPCSAIGAGNVEVAEAPSLSWSVFFTGKFAYTDVPAMSSSTSLTGTENPRVGISETAKQPRASTATSAKGSSPKQPASPPTPPNWRSMAFPRRLTITSGWPMPRGRGRQPGPLRRHHDEHPETAL